MYEGGGKILSGELKKNMRESNSEKTKKSHKDVQRTKRRHVSQLGRMIILEGIRLRMWEKFHMK